MRRFLDEAELSSSQRMPYSNVTSQVTREVTNERSAKDKGAVSAEDECRQAEAMKDVIRAFRTLLYGYEEQRCAEAQQKSDSDDSEAEEVVCQESPHAMMVRWEEEEDDHPIREPQRYLCDDWIQPVKVTWKPRAMTARETKKARVVKNCLILTLMSLELGFGSVIERYQNARDAVVERYQQGGSENPTFLPSELLTKEEMSARTTEQPDEAIAFSLAPASMPPPTCLLKGKEAEALRQVSCRNIGLEVGPSPDVLFVVKTDSQVTLTQLRNESVTTRSRPFANKFNYARDMCYGTSVHPASVKAVFEPGKSQKADGLTKVLSGASMKSFVSDLGLAPLIH